MKWMRKCFANELRVHAASLLINASFSLCHDFGLAHVFVAVCLWFVFALLSHIMRKHMENRLFI